jgi:hypothetical protein
MKEFILKDPDKTGKKTNLTILFMMCCVMRFNGLHLPTEVSVGI